MAIVREPEGLQALQSRARRLLAVFPHPDDEAYGCAGTLARLGRDPDAAAVLLCLTRGEASAIWRERGLDPHSVGDLREARLVEVAEILQLDGLLVATLPDGKLARCGLDEVSGVIRRALEALRPQVVIGHDPRGVNGHPDHIATHWALRHALLGAGDVRLAMLAYPPSVVEAVRPRLIFPTPEEEIDAIVHLTEHEIEAKEACLRIHEALVTLRDDADPSLIRRPPVERYDFLGEDYRAPLDGLFDGTG
jgi:LmbE family N-acetylglucosaminyl deacetylase